MTCDFQQCDILTIVDSCEPVQPPFKLRNSKWWSVSSFTVIVAKDLISLRICAGWSEPLLVAHTTLLKISCHGSYVLFRYKKVNSLVTFISRGGEGGMTKKKKKLPYFEGLRGWVGWRYCNEKHFQVLMWGVRSVFQLYSIIYYYILSKTVCILHKNVCFFAKILLLTMV